MSAMLLWGALIVALLICLIVAIALIRLGSTSADPAGKKAAGVRLGASFPETPRREPLPDVLGGCRIERIIGRGEMGIVYLGREAASGQMLAIKAMALAQEFAPELLDEARTRFFREAEAATRVHHSAIIETRGVGEDQGLAWIAMEFFPGKPLSDWTQTGHLLPFSEALAVVRQIALALDHAHGRQVVHRDIKPANILYDPVGRKAKLTDFGVARLTDASRTRTGMVLGTPAFMSPEQLAGQHIDGRSDLYSLGVVLYQLTTGMLPFSGNSLGELMHAIIHQRPDDPRIHHPKLPAALVTIIMKALQKEASARFQTGAQFALALVRLEAAQKKRDSHA